jgi:acyl-CoA reductase-like NAD-dependent aldehyde dehydrogenase
MSRTPLILRHPWTGERSAFGLSDDAVSLAAKAQALRAAQPAWAGQSAEQRAFALAALRDALARRREAMLASLFADTGRVRESVLEFEATLSTLSRWAQEAPTLLAPPPPRPSNIPFIEARQRYEPYPLVGVISPWNFPLLLALIDAIPALAAGCAVLVKPSELACRFTAVLEEALSECPSLPLAIALGDGRVGAMLIEAADLICFTGSVATGRKVGEACMRRLIPCFLELGGKDPALVFADADLSRAARAIAWGGLANAGQSCMSIERVYVEQEAFPAFVAALVAEVGRLRLNDADPAVGEIGPIIAERQVETIRAQLEDAYAKGARALTGGRIVERHGGFWCEPTVLIEVHHGMRMLREETFGPILPVMPFRDEAEAVALANDSEYGLSAAVFSADPARAERVAAALQAGAVSLNDASLTSLVHSAEKTSYKCSGLGGSRMGPSSILRFLRKKALLCNPGAEDPWWFPGA